MGTVGCFVHYIFAIKSRKLHLTLITIVLLSIVYMIILSLLNEKQAQWKLAGTILCVSMIVLVSINSKLQFQIIAPICFGLIAYLRVCVAALLQIVGNERGLYWCGAFIQIGSFIGAIIMFLLTNVFNVF